MPEKCSRDPRDVLVQEKYYTHLPDPLLDWLIRARIPDSAKRVFLAHWRAGHINGDWCSEIPLKTLAAQCQLDVSTVTRAYQLLGRHGLIRREDPGRDPSRPFQQAVAITEVRLPRELVCELDRYPNRRPRPVENASPGSSSSQADQGPVVTAEPASTVAPATDPFAGLTGRERVRALSSLMERMSDVERTRYHDATRKHRVALAFDADSKLTAEEQRSVLAVLAIMARAAAPAGLAADRLCRPSEPNRPRRLSTGDLARLRRDLQTVRGIAESEELLREVVWAVEEGALSRFAPLHATRIAMKKVREGAWTRPNRMPPQWALNLSRPRPATRGAGRRAERAGDQPVRPSSELRSSKPLPRRSPDALSNAFGPLPIVALLASRPGHFERQRGPSPAVAHNE